MMNFIEIDIDVVVIREQELLPVVGYITINAIYLAGRLE